MQTTQRYQLGQNDRSDIGAVQQSPMGGKALRQNSNIGAFIMISNRKETLGRTVSDPGTSVFSVRPPVTETRDPGPDAHSP